MSSNEPVPVPVATGGQFRLVVGAGLITTTLALFGVYLLNRHADENIMGWYANYVIPAGAILVGLVAASGYGLASWFAGVKITKLLLWTIVLIQIAAYFAAQYIEFTVVKPVYQDGTPLGFWEYFDAVTRAFAWKGTRGKPGQPLGMWGYGLRALEIVGFVLGSLILPIVLWKKAYCSACQVYFRTKSLGLIPAGIAPRKVKKSDAEGQAAYAKEQEDAWNAGAALLGALTEKAAAGDADGFRALLADHAPKPKQKEYAGLARRIALSAQHCPRCHAGFLAATVFEGKANEIKQTPLGQTPLAPPFVRSAIVERK